MIKLTSLILVTNKNKKNKIFVVNFVILMFETFFFGTIFLILFKIVLKTNPRYLLAHYLVFECLNIFYLDFSDFWVLNDIMFLSTTDILNPAFSYSQSWRKLLFSSIITKHVQKWIGIRQSILILHSKSRPLNIML